MFHLVYGNTAAGSLRQALGVNCVAAFPDPLSCGPVPPLDNLEQWCQGRHDFWRTVYSEEVLEFENWHEVFHDAAKDDVVTLWLGTGPDDQLFAAWVLAFLEYLNAVPEVRVVQFTTVPNRHGVPVRSISMLSVPELQSCPVHRALAERERLGLAALWQAWTSSSPEPLCNFIDDARWEQRARQATKALLDRYPHADHGVSRWELVVMRNIAEHGPSLARAVGHTLGDATHTIDHIGDLWLFWRVRRLADVALPWPLIKLDSEEPVLRGRTARLTERGRAVIQGNANAIAMNGIDDWIGGVHLDSTQDQVWLRTADGLRRGGPAV